MVLNVSHVEIAQRIANKELMLEPMRKKAKTLFDRVVLDVAFVLRFAQEVFSSVTNTIEAQMLASNTILSR